MLQSDHRRRTSKHETNRLNDKSSLCNDIGNQDKMFLKNLVPQESPGKAKIYNTNKKRKLHIVYDSQIYSNKDLKNMSECSRTHWQKAIVGLKIADFNSIWNDIISSCYSLKNLPIGALFVFFLFNFPCYA